MIRRTINENVIINVIIELKGIKSEYPFLLKFDKEKSLGREFKDFTRLKNLRIDSIYYIYLSRNQKIIKELDKEELLSKSGIKTKDTVIITDKKLEVNSIEKKIQLSGFDDSERNNAYIYPEKSYYIKRRNIKNKPKEKLNKKYLLILILIPICLMIIIGWLLYYFIFYKKKKISENSPPFEKEDLIVKINYLTDILYKYENNKILKMKGGQKNKEGNITKEQMLFADIYFLLLEGIF